MLLQLLVHHIYAIRCKFKEEFFLRLIIACFFEIMLGLDVIEDFTNSFCPLSCIMLSPQFLTTGSLGDYEQIICGIKRKKKREDATRLLFKKRKW